MSWKYKVIYKYTNIMTPWGLYIKNHVYDILFNFVVS